MIKNTKATKWFAVAGAAAVIGIGAVGVAASANAAPVTGTDQAQVAPADQAPLATTDSGQATQLTEVPGAAPDLSDVTFSTPVVIGTVPVGAVPEGEAAHTTAAR